MSPIDDAPLLFNLVKHLQNRVSALEELDIAHRLVVIEKRCTEHTPIIDDVKEAKIRSDERDKAVRAIYGKIAAWSIGFGTVVAILANGAKIIEVIARFF